jgi:hypothetical protein
MSVDTCVSVSVLYIVVHLHEPVFCVPVPVYKYVCTLHVLCMVATYLCMCMDVCDIPYVHVRHMCMSGVNVEKACVCAHFCMYGFVHVCTYELCTQCMGRWCAHGFCTCLCMCLPCLLHTPG